MHARHILSALCLSGLAAAAPAFSKRGSGTDLAATIIGTIMPKSMTCDVANTQCSTNVQAAPKFIEAFIKYQIFNYAQMASILALTAIESVDLQYRINLAHPDAGQGTSNMQMANYNQMYAESIPELKDAVTAAGTDVMKVLNLVIDDKYNFGSGAWFLKTVCKPDVMAAFETNPDDGFAKHMQCVGVDPTADGRGAKWALAKQAFGL